MVAVAILQECGINVSTFLASLGLLGLAVSLAAKDTLENIISGFVLLLDKPILSGEAGKIAGVQGTVEEIGLRSQGGGQPEHKQLVTRGGSEPT